MVYVNEENNYMDGTVVAVKNMFISLFDDVSYDISILASTNFHNSLQEGNFHWNLNFPISLMVNPAYH